MGKGPTSSSEETTEPQTDQKEKGPEEGGKEKKEMVRYYEPNRRNKEGEDVG